VNLHRRLEKLEARPGATRLATDMFVRFVSPELIGPASGSSGPGPYRDEVHRITCGDQAWHRLEDETEEAFQERAKVAAAHPARGRARVFLCYPDDTRG